MATEIKEIKIGDIYLNSSGTWLIIKDKTAKALIIQVLCTGVNYQNNYYILEYPYEGKERLRPENYKFVGNVYDK